MTRWGGTIGSLEPVKSPPSPLHQRYRHLRHFPVGTESDPPGRRPTSTLTRPDPTLGCFEKREGETGLTTTFLWDFTPGGLGVWRSWPPCSRERKRGEGHFYASVRSSGSSYHLSSRTPLVGTGSSPLRGLWVGCVGLVPGLGRRGVYPGSRQTGRSGRIDFLF